MQLFFYKVEKGSIYQKLGYEYQLFLHSNFLGAAMFYFYDAIWLLLLLRINVLLYTTMEQPYYVLKNSKWQRPGKFKCENSQYSYPSFWFIETFFPLFKENIIAL